MASHSDVIIRADAGALIGLGHIMRCLPIAQALIRAGASVTFAVGTKESLHVLEQVLPRFPEAVQMERVCLQGEFMSGEGASDKTCEEGSKNIEAALVRLAGASSAAVVLLDSYDVDAERMRQQKKALNSAGTALWYLDDLLAFAYPADGLINYSFYADRAAYERLYRESESSQTKERCAVPELLLGPSYVPLRDEFHADGAAWSEIKDGWSVLLLTGGTDPCHILPAFLEKLKNEYRLTAVIGAMNPDRDMLLQQYEGCGNICLLTDVRNLSELMRSCDFAVTAAGVTLYELCALGTLSLCYTLADNQLPNAQTCARLQIMPYLGDARENRDGAEAVAERALENLRKLTGLSEQERKKQKNRMRETIDGQGAQRIAKELVSRLSCGQAAEI
ncbi:MAG: UDP-2,4-diacetamido-2,4,6-trideoxy-beta-L-altropyranose hydrolase [Lachnospiraceae bacterium]|nr:UDP-2,4-diacetamido-2,4,6-trideoxy-beta-L-altropyranose hydrolase [Lachnospiraceae bacterium]